MRFGYLFSYLLLAACASDDPRYRDISALEKPPKLVIEKHDAIEEAPENAEAEKLPEDADSVPEEDSEDAKPKTNKGLGDQLVSVSDTAPLVLTIRQSFDMAWNSLKQALSQSGIEMTDIEHDKGKFYVSYDADRYVSDHGSLIEKSVSLFTNDYAKQGYLLTLTDEGSATKVTAALVNDAEFRKRTDHDDEESATVSDAAEAEKPTDSADKLLRSLYLTLKDDLREN